MKKLCLSVEDEFIPTRRSLLSRLKNWGDDESWRVFFDTYWKLIYRAAVKAGLTDAEAQDAVQETMLSVAKSMPEFKYREEYPSFKRWLLQLTRWRVADQLRKRGREGQTDDRSSGDGTIVEDIADPASADMAANWDAEWEMNLMEAAIERVKRKVDPKLYQLFDCYFFKGWPVARVARTFDVNVAYVYLNKHRINKLIKEEVTRLQAKPVLPRLHTTAKTAS